MTHAIAIPRFPKASSSAALALALLAAACSNGSSGNPLAFTSHNTKFAIAQDGQVEIAERWILYQADEFTQGAAGTNLNSASGDLDSIDSVAILLNMATGAEVNLGVAVRSFEILGSGTSARLYLVVDETQDSKDWNADNAGVPDGDLVLLTTPATGATNATLTLVSTLADDRILQNGGRLYFVEDPAAGAPLAVGESAIDFVTAAQPLVGTRVSHAYADNAANQLIDSLVEPHLVALDSGLIFFTVDETAQTPASGFLIADLNGDSDDTDARVLGLLDATSAAGVALNVARAVASDSGPVRALSAGTGDWVVAFLVNEADQGAVSLDNGDPANLSDDLPGGWFPAQCGNNFDADTADDVLAYLTYADWVADPVANHPINTGLAGKDRVLALKSGTKFFVATISSEADAECNLNNDSDADPGVDDVVRWAPVGGGTAYFTSAAGLIAIEDVAGGVHGLTDLGGRLVAVVSESDDERDYDGNPAVDNDLVVWLNPAAGAPAWVADHSPSTDVQAAGADWMNERSNRDRLLVTFQEEVADSSLNSGGDTDKLDSLPSFARFDPVDDLDFPGPPIAVQTANAGIAIAGDIGFYRVDEAADNRDWNNDGAKNDFILYRTTVSTLQNSNFVGVSNSLPRPIVETGGGIGAAYLCDETMVNADLNKDNKIGGFVLRWFRLP